MIAWRLSDGVCIRDCADSTETLFFESFSGSAHVVTELGSWIVERCAQAPRTLGQLVALANENFEADQAEELNAAVADAVRKLHSLGILTPCPTDSGNLIQTQSSDD